MVFSLLSLCLLGFGVGDWLGEHTEERAIFRGFEKWTGIGLQLECDGIECRAAPFPGPVQGGGDANVGREDGHIAVYFIEKGAAATRHHSFCTVGGNLGMSSDN